MRDIIEFKEENYHWRPNYDFIIQRAVEEEAFIIVPSLKLRLSIFQHISRANKKSQKAPLKCFSTKLKDERFLMRISEHNVHNSLNEYEYEGLKKRFSLDDHFTQLDQQGYIIASSFANARAIIAKYKKARNLPLSRKGNSEPKDKGYECSELKDGRVILEIKK